MKTILAYGLLFYWISMGFISLAQQPVKSPVPFWQDSFDGFSGTNNTSDYVGFFTQKPGVYNQCLNFDGFTTSVVCPIEKLPDLKNGFTVEAWIAPQEYPWNWTGTLDQAKDTTSGFSFGINYLGQIGFQAFADGKWKEILSPESVPLLKWSHVTGSYDPKSGFTIYINGIQVAEKSISKGVVFQHSLPVVIGKSQRKQYPALTERVTSKKFLSELFFDGLIDEYYYIYPDAVAVRYQEIHGPKVAGMEWQQTELINQPGTRPQDNVHLQAMTIANMNGETETWSWEKPYGHRAEGSDSISNGMIAVMNLKSKQKHFVIGETGAHWKPFTFGAREGFSTIPTWNHWPVATLPNDGRVAPVADRPSSSCFGTLYPVKHKSDRHNMMTGRNLYGLTEKPAAELAILARSWNSPAPAKVIGDGFESEGYDMNQRAYMIRNKKTAGKQMLQITLEGSENSPILNPAFVIENWDGGEIAIKMDGKNIARGNNFRVGKLTTLECTQMIIWIKTESKTKISLLLESKEL